MPRHLLQSPSYELLWQPECGTFRLQSPGRAFEGGPGIEFVLHNRVGTITAADLASGRAQESKVDDAHGEAQELCVHYQELSGLALTLWMRLYANRPFALIRLSVANVGTESVHLRRFFIESVPEGIETTSPPIGCYTNGWQSRSSSGFHPVGTRKATLSLPERWLQGAMNHNGETPHDPRQDRFWSEMCGALVTQHEALIGGIVSTADQFGQMRVDLRPTQCCVMLQTQMDDVALAVGESRYSGWYYLEWTPLPNRDPFAQYAHAVARQMGVAATWSRGTGWCSAPTYGRQVTEAHVMENLAAAALLADEIPLRVLQIDEGYQEMRGDWFARQDRFPHGLDWLADRIRGSGFHPGLWLAPLVVSRSSEVAREHPDWLLRGANGRPLRLGGVGNSPGYALDATHPDVLAYVTSLVATVVHDWGYDYLKLDCLYAAALPGQRHDRRMTRAQSLRGVLTAIRAAAGPDTYLVGCGAPLGPAVGIVDAMRIGPDTATTWKPDWGMLTKLVENNPVLPSLRNSLRAGMTRAWMHGRWWMNDPDALLIRERQTSLTEHEILAHITLVGLNGGTVMVSDDLDDLSAERRQMVAALFPPLLDGLDVPDLFTASMPETAIVPVARPWGRWRLIALFNWSSVEVERELPDAIVLDERKSYHLVDYWAQRYLRVTPGALRPVVHIPPHGVVLLGLRPAKAPPQVVNSTFHISQGGEISHFEVLAPAASQSETVHSGDNGREISPGVGGAISFTIEIGRAAKGAVWLSLPARPEVVTLDGERLSEKSVRAIASGIWAVTCRISGIGTLRLTWSDPDSA